MQPLLLALLLSALAGPAPAESPSTLAYLQNQPITLMDFGLLQTTLHLKEMDLYYSNNPKLRKATYHPHRETIILTVVGTGLQTHADTAKAHCRFTVDQVKAKFYIDAKTGKRKFPDKSVLGSLFSHWGQVEGKAPAEMAADLEHRTEIVVHLPLLGRQREVRCRSDLRGTQVDFFGEPTGPEKGE
jgi:hypothetical protein